MPDLHREWFQCERPNLERYNITSEWEEYVRKGRVVPLARDKFMFDKNGVWALILPIMEGGDLVDLLAFRPDKPAIWRSRYAVGSLVNGDSLVGVTFPVMIHRTPLEWLEADGEGVVVLDWLSARSVLRCIENIIVRDAEHEIEVWDKLAIKQFMPKISVAV